MAVHAVTDTMVDQEPCCWERRRLRVGKGAAGRMLYGYAAAFEIARLAQDLDSRALAGCRCLC